MRIRPILALVALAAWPALAAAQTPFPADSARLLLDPQVLTGTLPNGLRYYVRSNPKPAQRAELRLVVNAGSVLEDSDQLGLAHVVEHMAFNGSEHFQRHELVDYLESIGMRFGADLNASTGFDETLYMLQVPTDSGGALEKGLQILRDWAHGLAFDTTMIHKERGVVLEEWRLGQGAEERIRNKQLPVLFGGSRYAERLPIGTPESIRGFDPRALVRFYRDWYRPDLMAVVAVGDFDAKRVEAMIRASFAPVPSPSNPRARGRFPVPGNDTTRYTIATDREADGTRVSMYWKLPADSLRTEADFRRQLVARLYDRMLSARLQELAQRPDPPFIGAGAGRGRLVRADEVFFLGASVRDGGAPAALDALVTEAERARRFGFTAGELSRQKAVLLRYMEQAYAERAKTESAVYAGEYADAFLTGDPAPGVAAEYALYRDLLPGITLDETNAAARRWAGETDRVVLASAPDKPGLAPPTREQLAAAFDAARSRPIAPYRDDVADAPLVPALPAPARIVSERVLGEVGARELRLGNGIRVILRPTDFKADEVLLDAWSPGGASLLGERDAALASVIPGAVRAGGLGTFSQIELTKALAGKAARIFPSIDPTTQGLMGSASPRDLETLFQLVYLTLTAPRADTAAFLALKQRLRAAIEDRGADPEGVYSDSLEAVLTRRSPRARPLTPALLDSLDLGSAMGVYRERFGDAGAMTFVVVGSFDADSIRPLVVKYLGALPSLARRDSVRDVMPGPPAGVVRLVVRRGVEPKSRVDLVFSGPFEFTAANRHTLDALAAVLDLRLRDVLREQLGGTYDIGADASSSRDPRPRYSLEISFGCAPDRVDALTARVLREIARMRADDPRPADLAKVKEQERRAREVALQQNGWWLQQLAFAAAYAPDFSGVLGEAALTERLDGAAIRRAARAWLRPDRYVQGVLLPEHR
jgi:zinc protease